MRPSDGASGRLPHYLLRHPGVQAVRELGRHAGVQGGRTDHATVYCRRGDHRQAQEHQGDSWQAEVSHDGLIPAMFFHRHCRELPVADVVDSKTRSRMMSGIRGKNTRPEMAVRRYLHKQGFRYRLHNSTLPGKPDLTLPKYRTVIFVHGCFWHMHHCQHFVWPKTRQDFWKRKITDNVARDERNEKRLMELGWRVLVVWECDISPLRLAQLRKQILA